VGLVSRHRKALLLGVASILCTGILGARVAQAQETAAGKQGRVTLLERLVVGAGVEKVAIDTPQAVTVVEQEEIDQKQAATVGEILRDIPGVNTSGSDRVLGQTFNIRGVGAPESANEEGRIIVQVDGANKYYEQYRVGGFFAEPELYRRVEVLRGSASSTLYGSGALGGVILFETKDASDFIREGENGALRLKGGYTSSDQGGLGSAILAQRMGQDAEFLLAGTYRAADEYETGDGNVVRSSDFESWSGLAKGTFDVGEEGKLRLSYQQWDSDADDQDFAQLGTQTTFGTIDRHVIDRTAVVSYENPVSGNDMLDLKLSASYSDTTVEQTDASGNSAFRLTCLSSVLFCDSEYAYRTWQLNAENRMEWQGEAWENFLTVGVQTAHQTRVADVVRNGDDLPVTFHPEGTDLKAGVFVQNEFIWDERLTLIPGVRVDWRWLEPDEAVIGGEATEDTALSPKLAAHYKVTDWVAVFGSVAHTERFPSLDETFSTSSSSSVFLPSLDLEKERSNNYELGFALSGYDLVQAGDAAQLKTTGFYNDITDLIALNPARGPTMPGFINVGEAEIYGFEVEAAYDSTHVFASAGYSYVEGKDKQTDEYLTTIAPHELSFTLGGKIPEHALRFGWRARFVADPQDERRRSDEPVIVSPSRAVSDRYAEAFKVHDLFVSWTPEEGRFAGWDAQFGVENVFDKQYKEFLHNDPAKGRTFKVSLAKQLGW
jgi:hemoglobin/transferrin/lactoferrin receptor protein